MEIRVEQRMSGRAWRDDILRRHGGRAALTDAAGSDVDAAEDAWMLERIEEGHLDEDFRTETVFVLDEDDVQRLTPARFRLLDVLAQEPDLHVSALAKRLDRDKKNVSDDVRFLEEIGLVASVTEGRQKRLRLTGNEIHIVVGA